jgi:hypothetical protein
LAAALAAPRTKFHGEPHTRLATLWRPRVDEIAPAQRDRSDIRSPPLLKKADQGVVAGLIFDGLGQREHLVLAQDPLGEFLLERWPVDRCADVERQVPIRVVNDRGDLRVLRQRPRVAGAGPTVRLRPARSWPHVLSRESRALAIRLPEWNGLLRDAQCERRAQVGLGAHIA